MGIPEVVVKEKKKKGLIRRMLGFDLFLDFVVLFGLLWIVPEQLVLNILPQLGFAIPTLARDFTLLFTFWMQLLALACLFIFALSMIQRLGRGRRKKSALVRARTLPSTPSVPPHRVEKHNEYLAAAIKKQEEEQAA